MKRGMPVRGDESDPILQSFFQNKTIYLLTKVMSVIDMQLEILFGVQGGGLPEFVLPFGGVWIAIGCLDAVLPLGPFGLEFDQGQIQSVQRTATHQSQPPIDHINFS